MKYFLIVLVTVFTACNNLSYQEFSNKAEATNLTINGLKEGRWIEYLDSPDISTNDPQAPYYKLTIYKAGKPFGIERTYYKTSAIRSTVTYVNGKKNGSVTIYYLNGPKCDEQHYINDTLIDTAKEYYENGKLKAETNYSVRNPYQTGSVNGQKISIEEFYKNGKRKRYVEYRFGDTLYNIYNDTNGKVIYFIRYNREIYTYYKNSRVVKSHLEIYDGNKKLEDQYDTTGKLKNTIHFMNY